MTADVVTVKDLIEDWIQMRVALQRHIRAVENRALRPEAAVGDSTEARLRRCLQEINALLKEHATADCS
jgi:hypothetical protein